MDAIATENKTYLRESQSGALALDNYQVIWESDPIPNNPIVISSKLPEPLKINLRRVLIDAPEGLVDVKGADSAGYTIAEDRDYNPIRKLKTQLKL